MRAGNRDLGIVFYCTCRRSVGVKCEGIEIRGESAGRYREGDTLPLINVVVFPDNTTVYGHQSFIPGRTVDKQAFYKANLSRGSNTSIYRCCRFLVSGPDLAPDIALLLSSY